MKERFSAVKKLCSLLLCALMICGTVSVAGAAQDEDPETTTIPGSVSTPDEVVETKEPTREEELPFAANKNELVKDYENVTYVSAKGLTSLTLVTEISADRSERIAADLAAENTERLAVKLLHEGDEEPSILTAFCKFSVKDNRLTTVLDLSKAYPDGMADGKMTLTVEYTSEGAEQADKLAEKKFTLVTSDPVVGDVTYDGESESKWTNKPVKVAFSVSSPSPVTVKLDDEVLSAEDGVYSFISNEYSKHTVTAKDVFGAVTTQEIGPVKCDMTPPEVESVRFVDEDGNDVTPTWTNKDIIIAAKITDSLTNIKKNSITLNNEAVSNDMLSGSGSDVVLTFKANAVKNYTFKYQDAVGNDGEETIESEDILLDKESPAASDVALSFSVEEGEIDKVLSFLAFGIYSKKSLKVEVQAEKKGDSEQTVQLYNGDKKLEADENGAYTLSLDESVNSTSFDLKVVIQDEAGNNVSYSLKNDKIKTKLTKDAQELFANNESVSDLIISKLAPTIDKENIGFEGFASTYKNENGDLFVKGESGKVKVGITEEITGIASVKSTVNGLDSEFKVLADQTSTEKITNYTYEIEANNLKNGITTITVSAESNSRNDANEELSFTVDNDGPQLSAAFRYCDESAQTPEWNNEPNWTKGSVKVKFSLADTVGVRAVTCKSPSGIEVPVTGEAGTYTFVAEEYGEYIVSATDYLDNTSELKTAAVLIDNVPPAVVDNNFTFENNADTVWTSQPVKVSFKVMDQNENQCIGLAEDAVKVYDENGNEVSNAIDPETKICSFTAEKYAHYTYTLTDKLGNSVSGDVGKSDTKVLIDKTAPGIEKVVFSKDGKSYGTYGNKDFAMTVTVKNIRDGSDPCAPLTDDSVSVFNRDGERVNNISFVKRTPVEGTDNEELELKFTPAGAGALSTSDLNLILEAKDAAGNAEKFYLIKDAAIVKLVDGEGMSQGVYDVLATLATADITPIEASGFDKVKEVNNDGAFKGSVYNGKTLALQSTVTDTLAGLDEITVEYAKIDPTAKDIDYQKLALANDVTAEAVTGLDNTAKDAEASVSYQLNIEESGRYVFRITAKNNAGNESYAYLDFGVDNTKPVLKEAEVKGNIGKVGEKSIYMGQGDSENTIIITVSDMENGAVSAGIDDIVLSNYANDPLERIGDITGKDGVYQAVFKLDDNKVYNSFNVTVTDAFGQQTKNAKVSGIKVNGETVNANKGFELVVSSDENHFTAGHVIYKGFVNKDDQNKIYKPIGGETLMISFSNEFAGISDVTVMLDGKQVDADKYSVTYNPPDKVKHTAAVVTLDMAKLNPDNGEHTLSFIAVDNGGMKSKPTEETFYIDSQSPVVSSISIQPHQDSDGEKLFHLLTFGVFSNEALEAVVQIDDVFPSSGVKDEDIKLLFNNKELEKIKFESIADEPTATRSVKKTFVLPAGTDVTDSFYNDLKVKVKDVFGNGNENPVSPEKVYVNGKQEVTPGDGFDIAVNPQAPTVSFISYSVTDNKNRSDNWFSENPVVNFSVADDISRIHSVKVEVNGKTVTDHCTYGDNNEQLPDQFTTFNDETEDNNVSEANIALNTAGIELNQGENTVRVSATGNNGMSSTPVEWVFNMDYTAPDIKSIRFESTASPAEQWLNFVTFGLYSNNDIRATVTATDNESGIAADGIMLKTETGAEIEISSDSFAAEDGIYTKSFILKMGAERVKSFYNDLIVEVTNKVSLVKSCPYYEVENLDADDNKLNTDKDYDIYSYNKNNSNVWFYDYKPETGNTRYSDGSKIWFSVNPSICFDVGDIFAKIHAVKVTLNDVDVTDSCVYNDGGMPESGEFDLNSAKKLPESFTTFNDDKEDERKTAVCIMLDTAGLELKEGENVIKVVPVDNNGLEREPAQSVFYMDTKAPTPELITYERTTSPEDQWLNFVTFGLYSNESIKATVTVSDGEHSAGISSGGIVLKTSNGGSISVDDSTPFCYENGKYSKSFILKLGTTDQDSFFNDLSVEVTDRVSNSQTVAYNSIQNRKSDGTDIKVGDNFEVMSNSDAPAVTFKGFEENGEHTYYVDEKQQDWFAVEPKMHFHVEDHMSKIHSVEILVDKKSALDHCTYTDGQVNVALPDEFTKFNEDVDTNKRIESLDVTLHMDEMDLTEGQHEVSYTATGNNGMQQTVQTKYFWIETEPPVVESIRFEKSDANKVLNLLTFGLYSNDSIKATVTVNDGEHSSGIKSENFTMTSDTGTVLSGDCNSGTKDGKYVCTKTFTLQAGEDENYSFNDLRFSVTDNVSNNVKGYWYDKDKENKPITKVYNTEMENVTDKFELVASNAAPQITTLVSTPKDNTSVYPDNSSDADNGRYFSDYPDISAVIHDSVSKIQSVTVMVNGKNVTGSAVLTNKTGGKSDNLSGNGIFTHPNETNVEGKPDIFVSDLEIKLDTKTVAESVNEGLNTVKITALGNNGETKEKEITFIRDTTKPAVTRFDFSGDGYQRFPDGYTPEKSTIIIDYYYFFKQETTLTVTASDADAFGNNGSGIKMIHLLATPYEGTTERDVTKEFHGHVDPNNPNQYLFTIPANNKLRLRAYAIDNVNNNADMADTYAPGNQVVESPEMFKQCTDVSFSYQPNTFYDNKNQRLYASETSIDFTARSTYAGIRQVDYKVIAPIGSGTKILTKGTIRVEDNGDVSDPSVLASVKRDHDAFQNQLNIVQSFTKTVHFSKDYNYNGMYLEVTVTDCAEYVSRTYKSDSISVDTKAPEIVSIVFDNNTANDVQGKHYYNNNRTATITIRERNFNPDAAHLFLNISPNTRTLVPGANWNTTYNAEVENADNIEHVATVTFDADAEYSMSLSLNDLAGNSSGTAKVDDFVIDKTAPVIRSISWSDTPMGKEPYYRDTRTATITIAEKNFYSGYVSITPSSVSGNDFVTPSVTWNLGDGDTHTATITFAKEKEGKFAFDIAFKDNALNNATNVQSGTFYIDSTPPDIKFRQVEAKHAYDGEIAPIIEYFDKNFDVAACKYTLLRYDIGKSKPEEITSFISTQADGDNPSRTVTYENFAKSFKVDGIYRLEAEATDLAGNPFKDDVLFSVNRFGSTFLIDDKETKKLVNENPYTQNVEDVKVKEINVNKIEESSVAINYNDSTRQLELGKDYKTTESGGTGTEWFVCEYTMLKENYSAEGNYVTVISSVDHFKNKITNRAAYVQPDEEVAEGETPENRNCPVDFVVDRTKPLIAISGVSNDEYYEEPEKEVTITCDDANITLDNFGIVLDGKTLTADKDYTVREIDSSLDAKIVLNSDINTEDRTLAVTAFDKANNSETWEVKGFRLNASWFARFLHYHFPLFIIILAAIALLIGLAIFLIIKKRKKDKG